ncbi:GlxA family transcriptional regulator [Streptomyces sp. ODS28]|uniref:GlxA family transcriptional regulator n=1 Tax=Streptomyces sp. ODS28 TaxID=3136688 RepID=UPI0031F0A3F0
MPNRAADRSVLLVLFEGVQSLDVTGPLEVFAGAGRVAGERGYRVRTASPGGHPVRTDSGLRLTPDEDLEAAEPPHTLVVPGGAGTRTGDPGVLAALPRLAAGARRVVSVCTGAFLLAEAGLLAGRRATTHWAFCDALARRHPDVTVDPEPVFVRDGKVATSAGVTVGIDLALALVEEDLGRERALEVARHLVVFLRRPGGQAQFSAQLCAQLAERPAVRELQQWISENPAADLSVEALARRASLSPRQFARVFHAETGTPPGRYVDRVRLEAARRLLEDSALGIEETARSAGYGTPEAMRRAFLRALAVPPADYRARFRTPDTAPRKGTP